MQINPTLYLLNYIFAFYLVIYVKLLCNKLYQITLSTYVEYENRYDNHRLISTYVSVLLADNVYITERYVENRTLYYFLIHHSCFTEYIEKLKMLT